MFEKYHPSRLRTQERMLKKLHESGGILTGSHGTSASRARQILENGFENHTCVEGGYGVWFHDSDYADNAHGHGILKAKEDREAEYAIIQARFKDPEADFLANRPQWLAVAQNITEILDVQFYKV